MNDLNTNEQFNKVLDEPNLYNKAILKGICAI